MPTARALSLCPQAVVLKPDMAKYARVGREIRERMQRLTPLVEPLSIDEAFLDLTGCEGANGAGAALTLARFAREVEREVGVTVSVGLSYCKFLAKLASDLDKPRGFSIVAREDAIALLAPMGVGRLWGVGKVAEERLARLGLKTIGDLQALDERGGGAAGRRRAAAVAAGARDRRSPRDAGSGDQERFERNDVRGRRLRQGRADARLARALRAGGRAIAQGRARGGRRDAEVAHARTSSCARAAARGWRRRRWRRGSSLRRARCSRRKPEGTAYRLIGVGASDLEPASEADEADLIEGDRGREKAREAAIDALRDKFGAAAIQRGLAFKPGAAPRKG